MGISLDQVRKLREETQAGVLDCKNALVEAKGNVVEAKKILRKKGIRIARKIAAKRTGKTTAQGAIGSYVHHDQKVAALVEVHCQSDFVARNEAFRTFAKDIAMHVAAFDPAWVSQEQIPAAALEKQKALLRSEAEGEGKSPEIAERIIEGRLKKFFAERCLLEQPFLRDEEKTVADCLTELIAKIGENVTIDRVVRFKLSQVNEEGS